MSNQRTPCLSFGIITVTNIDYPTDDCVEVLRVPRTHEYEKKDDFSDDLARGKEL